MRGDDLLGICWISSLPLSAFLEGWAYCGASPWPGTASKKNFQWERTAKAVTLMAEETLPQS